MLEAQSYTLHRRSRAEQIASRLGRLGRLTEGDAAHLLEQMPNLEVLPAGRDLAPEDGVGARAGLLLSGWACRQRLLPDGRRQIIDLLMPGDFVGMAPGAPLQSTWTVCLTRVEFADGEALRRSMADQPEAHPAARQVFAALARLEQVRLLDHVVRLGRQTAYERVAHLLLELYERARLLGDADGGRFSLPLTQEVLADALGLSVVHVNRVLQQLRRDGYVELRTGQARLLNLSALTRLCDFTPSV